MHIYTKFEVNLMNRQKSDGRKKWEFNEAWLAVNDVWAAHKEKPTNQRPRKGGNTVEHDQKWISPA